VYIVGRMNKHDAAVLREIATFHPSFHDEQDSVDDLIQFFYDLVRDEPAVLKKVDAAFRQRYGYTGGDDDDGTTTTARL
jgi:hypothetical protein